MMSEAEFDRVYGLSWHANAGEIKQRITFMEYAGNPTNNVTPTNIGRNCFVTANAAMYVACGLTSADWKKLTP